MDCSFVGSWSPASKGSDFQITPELSYETLRESLASMGRDDLGGGRGSAECRRAGHCLASQGSWTILLGLIEWLIAVAGEGENLLS